MFYRVSVPKTKETNLTIDEVREIRDAVASVAELWNQLAASMEKFELDSIPAQAVNNKDIAIQRMESAVAGAYRGLTRKLMEPAANAGRDAKAVAKEIARSNKSLTKKVAEKPATYKKRGKK